MAEAYERPTWLPDFERPPLIEVAMGVHFAELLQMKQPHVGQIWGAFRAEYPLVEDHEVLASPIEGPAGSQLVARIDFGPRPARSFFLNAEGERLIQVQPDRFVHNWRKGAAPYPRYGTLREQFRDVWRRFREATAALGLGPLRLERAEITYVNAVAWAGTVPAFMAAFHQPPIDVPHLATHPVDGQVRFRVRLAHEEGYGPGALKVSAEPWRDPTSTTNYLLTLTVDGQVRGDGQDDVLKLMDRGHEVIVAAFKNLTIPKMHEEWGLRK